MVTKSGTNSFHGTAYNYLQNDAMNARAWLQPKTTPKPPLRYNLFGGVVSGPIWRDKAFFLGSYEGLRNKSATLGTGTVLTPRMRGGDFGEMCIQGFQPNGTCIGYKDTRQLNGTPTTAQIATYGKQIYKLDGIRLT